MAAAGAARSVDAAAGVDAVIEAMDALGLRRFIELTEAEEKQAVVMRRLCNDDSIVLRWVRHQQLTKFRWRAGVARLITPVVLDNWCARYAADPLVLDAVRDAGGDLRATIHLYMAESVVADWVANLTGRGLLVPSCSIVRAFANSLTAVPQAPAITAMRGTLANRGRACRRWSARFRDTWGFAWSTAALPHRIDDVTLSRRTGIFFRWIRHVLEERSAGHPCVVVNMDETFLHSVKSAKLGVRRRSDMTGDAVPAPRERVLPRTSLMASVASDADVQAVLPQVRLPRGPPDRAPSRRLVQAHGASGQPVITLHGSGGWVTSSVMKWYIALVARTVLRVRPGHRVVLVLDCCPVHLSRETLQAAAARNVDLVFIPARLTWLLQPLDTHVFAVLKRALRQADFEAKVDLGKASLTPLERVQMQGETIRRVLVERPWATTVQRTGLTGDLGAARPALLQALAGQRLEPQPPTAAELSDLLQVPIARATEMRRSLLCPPRVPVMHAAAAAAAAARARAPSGSDAPVDEAAAERSRAVVPRLARLPSAPRALGGSLSGAADADDGRVLTRSATREARARAASPL